MCHIDAQSDFDQQYNTDRRRSSSGGAITLPSRSFRYLQEQYSITDDDSMAHVTHKTVTPSNATGLRRGSDAHHPSRAFRYLQDQYHENPEAGSNQNRTINNREDILELYNKSKYKLIDRICIEMIDWFFC